MCRIVDELKMEDNESKLIKDTPEEEIRKAKVLTIQIQEFYKVTKDLVPSYGKTKAV